MGQVPGTEREINRQDPIYQKSIDSVLQQTSHYIILI